MRSCGLEVGDGSAAALAGGVVTRPQDWERLFPATGGSLYGRANHGALGSFQRLGAASGVPGLYLAGGSVHPGPGVPMATLSGRLAAARLLADAR
jgi:1-hydroxycarotenoid 3,4-desaturase